MERVGFAKVQFCRIENGLEQSKIGGGIFSKISKTTSEGRAEKRLSEGRRSGEVAGRRYLVGGRTGTKLIWGDMAEGNGREGAWGRGEKGAVGVGMRGREEEGDRPEGGLWGLE